MERMLFQIGQEELVDVQHDPYNAQMLIPYLSLRLMEEETQFFVRFGYGLGRLGFPSYSLTDASGVRYQYIGSTNALFSGAFLAGTKVSIPLSVLRVFAAVDYTTAKFEYFSVNNDTIDVSEKAFYDHVRHRTLSMTFGVTYPF